jgi:hypothetical protein
MTAQLTIDFEEQAKQEAFELMQGSELRAWYLDRVRLEMRLLAERWGKATPDDARQAFEAMDPPDAKTLSRNFLGCVFRQPKWVVVGTYRSQTPGSHANRLNIYALRGPDLNELPAPAHPGQGGRTRLGQEGPAGAGGDHLREEAD